MEGSTGNSKNVPKKSTRLGRMMGFQQYTFRLQCKPKSLKPACTKFSNFVPILGTSTLTTPSFISSEVGLTFKTFVLHQAAFLLYILECTENIFKSHIKNKTNMYADF